jgi:hypothetical protein
MKIPCRPALASLLLSCVLALPAAAGISPYVRLDYGGTQLRMTDVNQMITDFEGAIHDIGYPASFQKIGTASGASGSAGLWLLPGVRVGAIWSQFRSVRRNRVHVPGSYFFEQDLDFRMNEVGAEAAVRVVRLAGLSLGGSIARGRASAVEGLSEENLYAAYYEDATAHRTRTTYGVFVGLDQTNARGGAGYIRAGFAFRDMGRMPDSGTASDGVNTVAFTSSSRWSDYSGFYVKAGVGFDLVR